MSPRRPIVAVVALAALLPGCAGVPTRVAQTPPPGAVAAPAPRGVVFCADGAGGFGTTSAALQSAVAEQGVALEVRPVVWTHGFGRMVSDQVGCGRARTAGRQLAGEVVAWRQRHPGKPVYLVGHSAGSQVVLAAAECLPAGAVERVVLLAPSVSAEYDLRPALARTAQGVDAFYSGRDWVALGLGVGLVGTADRCWAPAAGRVGFQLVGC